MTISPLPPLSLYIHIPWCVRKCPYCDFNSHQAAAELPEQAYVQALLSDLDQELSGDEARPLQSIFFGGGTPSLFSASAIGAILEGVSQRMTLASDCEITLEANPGTVEQQKFEGYRRAGVNRLSLGIQSFHPQQLQQLGRIHSSDDAVSAVQAATSAGFANVNLDLMHGLPGQTVADAMGDLEQALDLGPTHLSWYQLTIEPNTAFYKQPPKLPVDDVLADIQDAGEALLTKAGFQHYEISAWAQPGKQARHNLNYWQFGDYIGIGAGAHGKQTRADGRIVRRHKTRLPADYLNPENTFLAGEHTLADSDRVFEFMLNALRLPDGIDLDLFVTRTGLPLTTLSAGLEQGIGQGLLVRNGNWLQPTTLGQRFHNDLVNLFN